MQLFYMKLCVYIDLPQPVLPDYAEPTFDAIFFQKQILGYREKTKLVTIITSSFCQF